MSYDQVAGIIGGPGTLLSAYGTLGVDYTVYQWAGQGLAGANATVYFRNGKEYAKAQYGLS